MAWKEKLERAPLALSLDDVLLVPQYSDVNLDEIDVSTRVSRRLRLRIPIISSPMDTVTGREMALRLAELGGLGVLPRNLETSAAVSVVREARERGLPIAAAVGPFDDERVKALVDAGVSMIVVDSAHGHSRNVIEATRRYKDYGVEVMSGNIVTGEAARALIDAGAEALRVGIGSGHACTTREVAGVGVPQLTAISWVAEVAREAGVGVVADGGIEKPAHVVKALAAGADAVMLGYLLAGTDEAPGDVVEIEGKKYKPYRGMGSRGALASGSARYGSFKRVPEGVEGYVEYRGPVERVVDVLVNALKQGMGYVGAKSLDELRRKAVFVRITEAGLYESSPRGMIVTRWL
ncbi:MAG: IMP dehydrogenase [Thermofilaceae archaeon]